MVTIRHIKTFVTFDFDTSLIFKTVWTKLNDFSGINWWIIELPNCKGEIAEKFDPAPRNGKNYSIRFFLFLSGMLSKY